MGCRFIPGNHNRKFITTLTTGGNKNADEGKTSVLMGYSLGKAQRMLQHLDLSIGKVYTHGGIANTNEALQRNGVILNPTTRVTPEIKAEEMRKGIVLCPPSAIGTPWIRKFYPYSFGYCSGWMALRGAKRRRAADRGFCTFRPCRLAWIN